MSTEKDDNKKCCSSNVKLGIFILIGIILTCLGICSVMFYNKLYIYMVKKELALKPGNEAYNNWYSPPTPVYMQYFFYNYTNYADVLKNGTKPQVLELGPYSYREIRINAIVEQNDYEITYLQNYSYVFDPATSCESCKESDMIWTPNVPTLTILSVIKALNITKDSSFIQKLEMDGVNIFLNLNKVSLFQKRSVYELLWGYQDPFLEKIKDLEDIASKLGLKLQPIDPFVALQRNGTKEAESIGNLTILTGKSNINDVQRVIRWRGLDHTNETYWQTKYGRMLNGSDGTHTKPFLERNSRVYLFTPDLARSLYVEYESDITVFDITLYRHTTSQWLFMNSSVNPDNRAFCGPTKCWGTGLLPIGQTQEGNPPLFMSSPHFYQGDQKLIDAIDGLHPNKTLHATFLDVEPITGIVMQAHKRLQMNVLAQPVPFITITEKIHEEELFLPILYIHELATIDQSSAEKFKKAVIKPKQYLEIGSYCILGIGILIMSVVIGVISVKACKNSSSSSYTKLSKSAVA